MQICIATIVIQSLLLFASTMRNLITLIILFYPLIVFGFVPSSRYGITKLALQITKEEDLDLTRKIIIQHIESIDQTSGGVVDDDDDDDGPVVIKQEEKQKKPKKKKTTPPQPAAATEIDISKLNIVVGAINKAYPHEDPTAEKLYCEEIDVGEDEPRQIASGLRDHYTVDDLVGRRVCVLANLKTRKLRGFPSHGMVLCASSDDGKVVFVDPPEDAVIGERVSVDGYDGEPATENQVLKKKMLDAIFPDLKTNDDGVASYKGVPLTAGTGKCIAEGGLANAQVN